MPLGESQPEVRDPGDLRGPFEQAADREGGDPQVGIGEAAWRQALLGDETKGIEAQRAGEVGEAGEGGAAGEGFRH